MAPQLSRPAVIDAARELIADEGLDAVSLRRLAARLGVTAPALYAYVADKQDLLRGVAEGEFARLIARFATIDDPDPLERLRMQSRAYIDHALTRPELFRTMFLFPPDLGVAGVASADALPLATTTWETAFATVTEAIAAGALHPTDPAVAAFTLWTATHGAATVLVMGFPFDDRQRAHVIDAVIETMLIGLGAPSRVATT